jgi:hypothetical protein
MPGLQPLKFVLFAAFLASTPSFADRLRATSMDDVLNSVTMKSREGRKIDLFMDSSPTGALPVVINGTSHGNEKLSREFVIWLRDRYDKNMGKISQTGLPLSLDFIPTLNPDGYARGSRLNAKEVNLNRNFPILWGFSRENPGSSPFSEPETRSLKKLFDLKKYKLAIDVHGYTNWVVIPSAPSMIYKSKSSATMKAVWKEWSSSIRNAVETLLPGYEVKSAGSLGDGGAFEDWAFWDARSWSACLELQGLNKPLVEMSPTEVQKTTASFERYEEFIVEMIKKAYQLDQNKVLLSDL